MSLLHSLASKWQLIISNSLSQKEIASKCKIHSMNIVISAFSKAYIGIYADFIKRTIHNSGGICLEHRLPKYELKRWTVLSSPFIHKKARSQFERRTYKRILNVYNINGDGCQKLVWYICRNSPPGIKIDGEFLCSDNKN